MDPVEDARRHQPPWNGIKPGDFGWDEGGGIVGWLITLGTRAPYAHCWVYHEEIEPGVWRTAEAYPPEIRWRRRSNRQVHRVMRVWRNEDQQAAILRQSEAMVGTRYAYRELIRIVVQRLVSVRMRLAGATGLALLLAMIWPWWWPFVYVFGLLFILGLIPISAEDNPNDAICSNHVMQAALAANPNIWSKYPPYMIWPGRAERDLALHMWNEWSDAGAPQPNLGQQEPPQGL